MRPWPLAFALLLAGCGIYFPCLVPSPQPPADPQPVCDPAAGLETGCWQRPEGGEWEYVPCPACAIPDPPLLTCANLDCAPGYYCEDLAQGPKCVPGPAPPATGCTFGTPTARAALRNGMRPEILPQRTGRRSVSATPRAAFGRAYYCQPGLWPEACAEGRTFGPVAPDGHPQRLPCEQRFLEAPCPRMSMAECQGTVAQCPITFDPFVVIDGVNQNHPANVSAGCRQATWEKNAEGQIIRGEFWWATAHGKGTIKACNFDGSVCTVSPFVIDQ